MLKDLTCTACSAVLSSNQVIIRIQCFKTVFLFAYFCLSFELNLCPCMNNIKYILIVHLNWVLRIE